MDDDRLQQRVLDARTHLERTLHPAPPGLGSRRDRGRRRRLALLAMAAGAAVVVGVVAIGSDRREGPSVVAGPSLEADGELTPAGTARRTSPSPLGGRSTMAAVWTGTEMVIWGGESSEGPHADGAAYEPRSDAWRALPEGPLTARNAPAAVWTGREVLLWGGHGGGVDHADGARLDPATGTWQRLPDAPMRSAGRPVAAWTGTEMLVLAGFNSRQAAAYDPSADRWRVLPDLPGQVLAPTPSIAWTGSRVITAVGTPVDVPTIYALDPSGTTWTAMPALPGGSAALTGRQVQLAWTGEQVLAVAGGSAAVLDENGDEWRSVGDAPTGASLGDATAVWTGTELLLWSGGDDAFLVDPVRHTWRTTPAGDVGSRAQPAAVWASGVFVAWGGFPDRDDGVVVRPSEPPADGSGAVTVTTANPGVLAAVLVPTFEPGVSGRSRAQRGGGSSWAIDVALEGMRPATKHVVSYQYRREDGSVSEVRPVCDFTSDATGAGTCSGVVDAGGAAPFRVSVGGYEESSNGYRTVADGEFHPA